MKRKLLILPENHLCPRRREAVHFAKEQSGNTKLFIEGVRRRDADAVSLELGYSITSIEHDRLPVVMSPFIAADGALRLNSFLWSVANRRKDPAAREFIKEEREIAAYSLLASPSRIHLDSVTRCLCENAAFSTRAASRVQPFGDVFGESLNEVLELGQAGIPPKLAYALHLLVEMMPLPRLERMDLEIYSEIDSFFKSRYAISVSLPSPAYAVIPEFDFIIRASNNPLALYRKVVEVLSRMKELRNGYMAYAIAREEFDIGVLNVGALHALENSMMLRILRQCGIETVSPEFSHSSCFFNAPPSAAMASKPRQKF